MKILLSSIGSRGDVQPLLALALELRTHGHDPRLCVAPNFREWIESFGLTCIPIGPDLEKITAGAALNAPPQPSAEQRRQLAAHTVRAQFPLLTEAARGCDLIVAAGALQLATRSVAEALNIPYVFAAYCPAVLPSPDHPPPKMGQHYSHSLPASDNLSLWREEEQSWNDLFGAALNEQRAALGLAPIDSVQRYNFTDRPWLAADPALAPPGTNTTLEIVQTGAWLMPGQSELPEHVERFLASGAPPVYFGFGSMRAAQSTGQLLHEAARALGLRSLISRGWGNLTPIDTEPDCLAIGPVPHEKLFPRVAAVVHHGGAGTTTAAARAGRPQVVVPHHYDQYYWAHRVQQLGIGVTGPDQPNLTVDALATSLRDCLQPAPTDRALALANRVQVNGTRVAAELVNKHFP
jgi:vancomycin aglycone glucosyltransferase